jgi:hypothetical protein
MKKTKWLSSVLATIGGPGRKNESLLNLLIHIGRTELYRDVWEEAVKVNGLLLPKFDGLTRYAIQSWCNSSLQQMSLLQRCLWAELGSTLFNTEYQVTQVVGLEHVVPQTGSYMYATEKVEWSYKNVVLVFTLWLKMKLAGPP